jgi:hypothetical protein
MAPKKRSSRSSRRGTRHGNSWSGRDSAGPPLTQVEFGERDREKAERIARRLGYTQTVYTTSSALWGLFCLPDRATQRRGTIIKTRELGLLFVQDVDA